MCVQISLHIWQCSGTKETQSNTGILGSTFGCKETMCTVMRLKMSPIFIPVAAEAMFEAAQMSRSWLSSQLVERSQKQNACSTPDLLQKMNTSLAATWPQLLAWFPAGQARSRSKQKTNGIDVSRCTIGKNFCQEVVIASLSCLFDTKEGC